MSDPKWHPTRSRHLRWDGGLLLGMLSRSQRGVTLLEVAVAMAVMGFLGAALVTASSRASTIPIDVAQELNTLGQVRAGSVTLGDDVRYSQVFVPKEGTAFASFEATDFASPTPAVSVARYSYDSKLKSVTHEAGAVGQELSSFSIIANIPDLGAVALKVEAGAVTTRLTQERSTTTGSRITQDNLLQAIEAPGPVVHPPSEGPPPIPSKAFCLGSSLTVTGKGQVFFGDGVVNGPLNLAGVSNTLVGDLLATGGVNVSGVGHSVPPVATAGEATCRMKLLPSSFEPFDFVFPSDTDLKQVPTVWQDSRRRSLKPGVYSVEGALTLDGSDITGDVTFIARSIRLQGSSISLRPRLHGVLLLALGGGTEDSIQIGGNDLRLFGVAYAGAGNASFTGSGNNLSGSIQAPTGSLTVSGANSRISLNETHFRAADKISQK